MESKLPPRRLWKGGKILLVPDVSCNYLARTELRRVIPYYFSNGFWAVFPLKFGAIAVKVRHLVPSFFVLGILVSGLVALRWRAALPCGRE